MRLYIHFSRLQPHFSRKHNLILVDYKLTLVENSISFSRIYTHLVDYIISFSEIIIY